jgi:hypothetical protein
MHIYEIIKKQTRNSEKVKVRHVVQSVLTLMTSKLDSILYKIRKS